MDNLGGLGGGGVIRLMIVLYNIIFFLMGLAQLEHFKSIQQICAPSMNIKCGNVNTADINQPCTMRSETFNIFNFRCDW